MYNARVPAGTWTLRAGPKEDTKVCRNPRLWISIFVIVNLTLNSPERGHLNSTSLTPAKNALSHLSNVFGDNIISTLFLTDPSFQVRLPSYLAQFGSANCFIRMISSQCMIWLCKVDPDAPCRMQWLCKLNNCGSWGNSPSIFFSSIVSTLFQRASMWASPSYFLRTFIHFRPAESWTAIGTQKFLHHWHSHLELFMDTFS